MDIIPPFLMNFVQSTVASVFISYISSMGETMPAVYTQRLIDNSDFYRKLLNYSFYQQEIDPALKAIADSHRKDPGEL